MRQDDDCEHKRLLPALLHSASRRRGVQRGRWPSVLGGHAAERLVRRRLLPPGWDAAKTPVVTAGISLAVVMALLGLRSAGTQAKAS